MTRIRERLLKKLADTIRESFNLTNPVSIDKLVSDLGGKIKTEEFLDRTIQSKVRITDKSFSISIKENEPERQFMIAKCIGHLLIHLGYVPDKKYYEVIEYSDSPLYRQGYSEEDGEATFFAEELLLPEEEFLEAYGKSRELTKLAEVFGVSVHLVRIRCSWFGLAGGYCW